MGSISPDSAGAKRSRLKVGPQLLRFRVCDSLLVLAWQVSFWSASHQRAACKQKYRYGRYSRVGDRCFSIKNASDSRSPLVEHYWIRSDHVLCTWDQNEKDDFGDDDKRTPTKLCLASASLHQHRSPAAVLPWLWRKQQIRDKGKREMGHVVWQSSYYCGFPDVHMKEQCWLLCPGNWSLYHPLQKGLTLIFFMVQSILEDIQICVLISSTSNGQVSFFIKQCFISEDYTCPWSKLFYLSSTLATHPTIQSNLDEFVTSSELCVDCCTVGQVNQDQRLPVEPAQSKECCPQNAMAFPRGGQKSSRKGRGRNVRQKWRVDDLLFDFTKQHHFRSV